MNDPEYKDIHIWDLKYISTSDEEDNDSSESSSAEEDDEDEEVEDKEERDKKLVEKIITNEDGEYKKIWKEDTPGKNESIP